MPFSDGIACQLVVISDGVASVGRQVPVRRNRGASLNMCDAKLRRLSLERQQAGGIYRAFKQWSQDQLAYVVDQPIQEDLFLFAPAESNLAGNHPRCQPHRE